MGNVSIAIYLGPQNLFVGLCTTPIAPFVISAPIHSSARHKSSPTKFDNQGNDQPSRLNQGFTTERNDTMAMLESPGFTEEQRGLINVAVPTYRNIPTGADVIWSKAKFGDEMTEKGNVPKSSGKHRCYRYAEFGCRQ